LEGGEVGLGGVVLTEFGLDIVVYGGNVFLEGIEEFADRFVGAVFDLVPLKGLEVVLDRLWLATLAILIDHVLVGETYCH
jgi:hypothetical protein